jgi:multiple sugar transport system permease protein
MAGFTMVILLAGMQAIPDEYYEASKIAGARTWRHVFHITLPLLRSSFALSLILSITGSILAFDQFMIMSKGGPSNETRTLMMYVYDVSFAYARLGSGAAIAIIVMLLLIGLTVIQLGVLRKNKSMG